MVVVPAWRGMANVRDLAARAEEAAGLVRAINHVPVAVHCLNLRQPRAATMLGSGQIAEVAASIGAHGAELVVVDAPLSPVQQRNLETALNAKVIDRTGLILEIFGERAVTAEGRLQVELAHLDYQAGRLVRSWTHLERQRGGYGFLGGPGETQIEADRRMIRERMARIRQQLDEAKRTRGLQRARRQRAPWPVIALVGYTNAGKSTLFNALTASRVLAKDLMFATLDPTMRHIALPGIDRAILSDTVGFVSDLPTELIAAFRATLEEVATADLIIHVRDISHPDSDAQYDDVTNILAKLGILPVAAHGPIMQPPDTGQGADDDDGAHDAARPVPLVELWNKADLLDPDQRAAIVGEIAGRAHIALVSAETPEDIDRIRAFLVSALTASYVAGTVIISAAAGDVQAWLYAHGHVEAVRPADPDGTMLALDVQLERSRWARLRHRWPDVRFQPLSPDPTVHPTA